MLTSLQNHVLWVTGASSGIGQAVALQMAKAGATVILTAKNPQKLCSTFDQIQSLGYPEPIIAPLNFLNLNEESAINACLSIGEHVGRLDGLIHCAGTLGVVSPMQYFSSTIWGEVFDTMVHAPFLLTKSALPLLKQSASARVLFTVNQQTIGKAYWGAYGAAQAAILSMADTLKSELENTPQVQIGLVDPIKARTAFRAKAYPGEAASLVPSANQVAQAYYQAMLLPKLAGVVRPAPPKISVIST